jgi:hypothetical protein
MIKFSAGDPNAALKRMTELFFKGISGSGLLMENFAEPSCLHNPLILSLERGLVKNSLNLAAEKSFMACGARVFLYYFFQDPLFGHKAKLIYEVRFCSL